MFTQIWRGYVRSAYIDKAIGAIPYGRFPDQPLLSAPAAYLATYAVSSRLPSRLAHVLWRPELRMPEITRSSLAKIRRHSQNRRQTCNLFSNFKTDISKFCPFPVVVTLSQPATCRKLNTDTDAQLVLRFVDESPRVQWSTDDASVSAVCGSPSTSVAYCGSPTLSSYWGSPTTLPSSIVVHRRPSRSVVHRRRPSRTGVHRRPSRSVVHRRRPSRICGSPTYIACCGSPTTSVTYL